jgi:hypothetical protein
VFNGDDDEGSGFKISIDQKHSGGHREKRGYEIGVLQVKEPEADAVEQDHRRRPRKNRTVAVKEKGFEDDFPGKGRHIAALAFSRIFRHLPRRFGIWAVRCAGRAGASRVVLRFCKKFG